MPIHAEEYENLKIDREQQAVHKDREMLPYWVTTDGTAITEPSFFTNFSPDHHYQEAVEGYEFILDYDLSERFDNAIEELTEMIEQEEDRYLTDGGSELVGHLDSEDGELFFKYNPHSNALMQVEDSAGVWKGLFHDQDSLEEWWENHYKPVHGLDDDSHVETYCVDEDGLQLL